MEKIFLDLKAPFFDDNQPCALKANLDNVLTVFHQHLETDIRENYPELFSILKTSQKIVIKEYLVKIVNNILSKQEGEWASKYIKVTQAHKQEILEYCYSNGVSIYFEEETKNWHVDFNSFLANFDFKKFSFFANNKHYPSNAVLVFEYTFNFKQRIETVLNDTWPLEFTDFDKSLKILELLNELLGSDYKIIGLRQEGL